RPLVSKLFTAPRPPIDARGTNNLPWELINETTLDRRSRPTFPDYLADLEGKTVQLTGHMQPIGNETDVAAFMFVEHPVGCWYCEMPEVPGIIRVEVPAARTFRWVREPVRVRGRLKLNRTDPENFLYLVLDASVQPLE